MSWLSDREIEHIFKTADGQELVLSFKASEDPPDMIQWEGEEYFRRGMRADSCNMTVKIAYEKNGLKAYEIRTGGSAPRYVSATALEHEKKSGAKAKTIESVYSKSVQKQIDQKKLAAEKVKKKD